MKIAICYHHIAHYREPIFTELLEHSKQNYEIISDDVAYHTKALKTLKSSDKINWKWHRIRTYGVNIRNHEFIFQPKLITTILKSKYDCIILLGDPHFISNWIILLICKLKNIPVLNWGIGIMRPEFNLKWLIRRFYLRLFSAHLLYGNWAKNHLISHGFDKNKIWVVYNSLDYNKMKSIRKLTTHEKTSIVRRIISGNTKTPIIFHSGRLVKRKKIDFIINAISKLKTKNIEVHLLVVGDGPEMTNLQRFSEEINVKNQIHFFGSCYDEYTLALLMSACDVSVAAGQLGLFSIQSLTFGLPVVTHDNKTRISGPESESIIHNKTGFLYEQDNIDSFVDCLSNVLVPIFDKTVFRNACYHMVDEYYNPKKQASIINQAVTASQKHKDSVEKYDF